MERGRKTVTEYEISNWEKGGGRNPPPSLVSPLWSMGYESELSPLPTPCLFGGSTEEEGGGGGGGFNPQEITHPLLEARREGNKVRGLSQRRYAIEQLTNCRKCSEITEFFCILYATKKKKYGTMKNSKKSPFLAIISPQPPPQGLLVLPPRIRFQQQQYIQRRSRKWEKFCFVAAPSYQIAWLEVHLIERD